MRLELSQEFLNEHWPPKVKSLAWAKRYHPNENFRNNSTEVHPNIFGEVNWWGLQSADSDEFIRDNYIYLGPAFFQANFKSQVLTVIHEVSHLVGVSEEVYEDNKNLSEFFANIPTQDYMAEPGSKDAINDAYIWEDYLAQWCHRP